MYKVIKYFTDLQDHDHPYNVGDEFPRRGMEVSAERLAELSGSDNRQHAPLIEKVAELEETEPTDAETVAEPEVAEDEETEQPYTAEALNELSANKIRAIAADLGYTIKKRSKAEIVEEFLAQQG